MKKRRISIVIIMISLSLFSCYHIYYYFLDKGSNDLVRAYYEPTVIEESKPVVKRLNSDNKEKYLGVLEIPKIELKQGFYNIDSKKNNVNKNITILRESRMPNEKWSIIYLVAHSGYGYLAYFKDLGKLALDDIINLDINGKNYQYAVSKIYELNKNGKISVNHNINEKYLVLSTCSDNKDKQLVVVSKLLNNNL